MAPDDTAVAPPDDEDRPDRGCSGHREKQKQRLLLLPSQMPALLLRYFPNAEMRRDVSKISTIVFFYESTGLYG